MIERIGRKVLLHHGGSRRLFIKGHFLAAAPALAHRFPGARFLTVIRTPSRRLQSAINYLRVNPADPLLGAPPWSWLVETIVRTELRYNAEELAWFTAPGATVRCVVRFDDDRLRRLPYPCRRGRRLRRGGASRGGGAKHEVGGARGHLTGKRRRASGGGCRTSARACTVKRRRSFSTGVAGGPTDAGGDPRGGQRPAARGGAGGPRGAPGGVRSTFPEVRGAGVRSVPCVRRSGVRLRLDDVYGVPDPKDRPVLTIRALVLRAAEAMG